MIDKQRCAENVIIELSERIAEIEKENQMIREMQMQIDRLEAEVLDKNKVIIVISLKSIFSIIFFF